MWAGLFTVKLLSLPLVPVFAERMWKKPEENDRDCLRRYSLKQMKYNLELCQELQGTEVEEPVDELQIGSTVDSMQFRFRKWQEEKDETFLTFYLSKLRTRWPLVSSGGDPEGGSCGFLTSYSKLKLEWEPLETLKRPKVALRENACKLCSYKISCGAVEILYLKRDLETFSSSLHTWQIQCGPAIPVGSDWLHIPWFVCAAALQMLISKSNIDHVKGKQYFKRVCCFLDSYEMAPTYSGVFLS